MRPKYRVVTELDDYGVCVQYRIQKRFLFWYFNMSCAYFVTKELAVKQMNALLQPPIYPH